MYLYLLSVALILPVYLYLLSVALVLSVCLYLPSVALMFPCVRICYYWPLCFRMSVFTINSPYVSVYLYLLSVALVLSVSIGIKPNIRAYS